MSWRSTKSCADSTNAPALAGLPSRHGGEPGSAVPAAPHPPMQLSRLQVYRRTDPAQASQIDEAEIGLPAVDPPRPAPVQPSTRRRQTRRIAFDIRPPLTRRSSTFSRLCVAPRLTPDRWLRCEQMSQLNSAPVVQMSRFSGNAPGREPAAVARRQVLDGLATGPPNDDALHRPRHARAR
jgi:hypothetical protein